MTCLEYAVSDYVAVITLNRPEKQNSLDPETVIRLAQAWKSVASDPSVRVAVITGSGSAFCSGGDLGRLIPIITRAREPRDEWEQQLAADRNALTDALLRDFDPGKPIISAINGHAVAGGMEIVLGTDIRIAAADARLGLQEAKWGVFPGGGGTVRLPAQIPHCLAMEMLLCGTLIRATEAHRVGLINHVVAESGDVLPLAQRIAATIAANGPIAVQAIRRSARESRGLIERDALALESELSRPVWKSEDAREGPRAFMEKRQPRFKGR